MKKLMKIALFALSTVFIFSCDKQEDDCVCTMIYDPVCGVDGTEYNNACVAECQGIEVEPCPITTSATVRDLGNPAVDGCGWVLQLQGSEGGEYHRPEELADQFKVDELLIDITYKTTQDSSICGWSGLIPVIELVEISE